MLSPRDASSAFFHAVANLTRDLPRPIMVEQCPLAKVCKRS